MLQTGAYKSNVEEEDIGSWVGKIIKRQVVLQNKKKKKKAEENGGAVIISYKR